MPFVSGCRIQRHTSLTQLAVLCCGGSRLVVYGVKMAVQDHDLVILVDVEK